MGGCAGKNKSKKSNSNELKLDSNKEPDSKAKDTNSRSNVSSSQSKTLTSSNGVIVNNDNNKTNPNTGKSGIDRDVQIAIDEQNGISNALRQPVSNRVVPVTDAELEIELARLVYGNPEKDYAENASIVPVFKSTEV
ncbi:unnamed protein product [Rotaria socialis]|uniref:Uncharacterized protein n=1 Tax=Rotaria socialis TaxID=392032 RepID=A0A818SWB8_9BILA|nr:unnamed protein product [Rotaria socialis]CAF3654593.1 unnamed protein product [Rotaria socialis]CAF3675278.1 unnamed protein product [Rotaria socialis]CAF4403411.1 unnamed protein product [Rotaria socialis]CAF4499332.1 unnamed protein product [Rotaria socialis]